MRLLILFIKSHPVRGLRVLVSGWVPYGDAVLDAGEEAPEEGLGALRDTTQVDGVPAPQPSGRGINHCIFKLGSSFLIILIVIKCHCIRTNVSQVENKLILIIM